MAAKMSKGAYSRLRAAIERRSGRAGAAIRVSSQDRSQKKDGGSELLPLPQRATSKYRAERCEVAGEVLDSKAEGRRFAQLRLRERAGEISGLKRQPGFRFEIGGALMFSYFADFEYFDHKLEEIVIEDVKGVKTPVYRLKKKIIEAAHKVKITEVNAKKV